MKARFVLVTVLSFGALTACSKTENAGDAGPSSTASVASKAAPHAAFPVLTAMDWKPVILEAVAADRTFAMGVVKTSTKYLGLSTEAMNAGRKDEGRRHWVVGHLLAWYGGELLDAAGVPFDEQRKSLLENRAAQVANSELTIEALRASFDAMNSQLELLGRPKCKSLSA